MRRHKHLLSVLIFLGRLTFVYAEDHDTSPVINLGQLSIDGELRKPIVTQIESQKWVRQIIPHYLKFEIGNFETELLMPEMPHTVTVPQTYLHKIKSEDLKAKRTHDVQN